jgi:hypothetical protein
MVSGFLYCFVIFSYIIESNGCFGVLLMTILNVHINIFTASKFLL